MVNGGDVLMCLVAGLAVPLALIDGLRGLGGITLPRRSTNAGVERRPLVWLLALIAGPGLFAERMLLGWHDGELSPADGVNGLIIVAGWAALYGYVLLRLVGSLVPA
jgi:hypothetical protein